MAQNKNKEYLVYLTTQANKIPVGILHGDFLKSSEAMRSVADGQELEMSEVAAQGSGHNEAVKQSRKDAHEVMQDPNQSELIISEKTTVPFSSEIGFTYFLAASSRLRLRGSLRKTDSGGTETKNGLHTVYLDGSVRIFAMLGTVHVFVLNGTVTADFDCTLANVAKPAPASLLGSTPSSESIISSRTLKKRTANSFKRRTSQLAIYKLGGKSDGKKMTFIGYCLGRVCKQDIDRDPRRFPLLPASSPDQSTLFILANPLDSKIKDDIRSLEKARKSCAILGSEQSRIVLFGTSGSGVMLESYWCVTVLTNQVQMIKGPNNKETLEMDSGQIIVKMGCGNIICLLDSECSLVISEPGTELAVDKHRPFDEKGNAEEGDGAVQL